MLSLYGNDALRALEQAHLTEPLMDRAGYAAAEWARHLSPDPEAPILIVAGGGNNGGDALTAARFLREAGHRPTVVFTGKTDKLPPDAANALAAWQAAGGEVLTSLPQGETTAWSLILDGLFGIGLTRQLRNPANVQIATLNQIAAACRAPVLALDCPSGLSAQTGARLGETVRATHTLSFIAAKPGLYTADGPDCCGEVRIAPLGIDLSAEATPPDGTLSAPPLFAPRLQNSHKGTYGSVGLIGGAPGMTGALLLAGRAALRLGAGRAYLGMIDASAPSVDCVCPELMLRMPAMLFDSGLSVLAVGPGLSQGRGALALLERAIDTSLPLILDADALNLLSGNEPLRKKARNRRQPLLLTPHPMEAAKLLGRTTRDIQADRIGAAKKLATSLNAIVALKGCGTVLAAPDAQAPGGIRWQINPTGNAGLATAGTGDVLTGMTAAFLAQGMPPFTALSAAVWLHGKAAEDLAAQGIGPIGLTASEVIDAARWRMNRPAGPAAA
ncbi:MAG: NAD(P)H-hydrate dehydratase [Zoogloeaceae bacterium]|nr:NAD(P)H-hydrate dehydratase [Zoogloeaceae bacterium]